MNQDMHYAVRTDVAIVGAGPIGLELAVAFKQAGVDYAHLDAHQIGHTFAWWPRNTYFFSTSERLAIAGVPMQNNHQQRITGEDYLAYLRAVVEQFDLSINTYEPVLDLRRVEDGFELQTRPLSGEGADLGQRIFWAKRVVLATGDMTKPHCLDIPGEALPHVSHYFRDPHDYFRKRLLVVGGRNSAVEAALRCWRCGAEVAICYRRVQFDEKLVKATVLPDLKTQIRVGAIQFYPETVPIEITPSHVILEDVNEGKAITHPADFVLLCTGFEADLTLLESVGVTLQGQERVPVFDSETMETDIPGLYVAGTAASGNQVRYNLFIENCHHHVSRIAHTITGQWPVVGTIGRRKYDMPFVEIRAN
ncbi:MAG: NAD(P)-binding domain-containing protein [Anaerolineae bacterium]|nr:NAD(P)-binding domain-containing protein [Anaerolineae bacterium]